MDIEFQCTHYDQQNNNEVLMLTSTNSLTSEKEEQQNKKDSNKQLKIVPIKVHKQILKSRKNPLKGFVKKLFEVVPIMPKQISQNHKYLLFGYQEVETYYRDYTNPFDLDLIDQSNSIVGFQSVERCNRKNELQINLNCKGSSGIVDFNFLIDHFSKSTSQDYRKLYTELIKYQQIAQQQSEHINYLKMKLDSKLITEEQLLKAREDFLQFIENYISQQQQLGYYFYSYQLYIVDVNKADIQYDRRCVSLSVLSLLGIEPSDYEQVVLHQGDGFECNLGKKRMDQLFEMLDIFVNGNSNKFFEAHLRTFDRIKIPIKELVEVVYWDGRPEWASKFDYVLLFAKFDLPAERIKQVIEIRQNKSKLEMDPDIVETYTFDYCIQTEIFLEKFYPDLFKDLKQKKSIKIKTLQQNQNQEEHNLE
ncbi:hypothetical protein TTHERM_00355400 (macronuclear) [Tetrahymena thermophila SB210]|uniref:Uncharacterized protein n=1 Tax=Tetrahymena thermophila (strain SB210) TaxID=312017 RepID=Q22Y31_TETTS|nr:hypothetical protein TTHERM_00355400 [Tetrahymena thermophila SB210]EAR90193.2 hypothetical protein TTHERM_00355400 [Tetrahymena thermophila SB210]|eukprot:XP_001010438.2 hypothetical protein TTHERM_00355400 [Tetrahymena thermophila SB210]